MKESSARVARKMRKQIEKNEARRKNAQKQHFTLFQVLMLVWTVLGKPKGLRPMRYSEGEIFEIYIGGTEGCSCEMTRVKFQVEMSCDIKIEVTALFADATVLFAGKSLSVSFDETFTWIEMLVKDGMFTPTLPTRAK